MIILKTDKEIAQMRTAGHFAWELLEMLEDYIKPGISTEDINALIVDRSKKKGAICAPLNYRGFA
jgi:methionyl aminopeptidase